MQKIQRKFLIIAGEASGDNHAADLVRALNERKPGIQWVGIGGDRMREAGVDLLHHMSELAVVGFTEILKHLPVIYRILKELKSELADQVDAVILVDYPGFNLRVARIAKKMDIPVIYYICPQLWAWGEKRVAKMRRFVDLLLVIFQFEVDFYRKHNITAHFVGHPLVEQIQIGQNETDFRASNQLPAEAPLLGLFPGSREMEIRNLLPTMVKAALQLQEKFGCVAVVGRAAQLPEALYDAFLSGTGIRTFNGKSHLLMQYAHAAVVASGTATLELGYLKTPMVILYAVSPLTYRLAKMLIKLDTIGLVNIVLGKKVVPELIQTDISPENICANVERCFNDPDYYLQMQESLSKVPEILKQGRAAMNAAEKIVRYLDTIDDQH